MLTSRRNFLGLVAAAPLSVLAAKFDAHRVIFDMRRKLIVPPELTDAQVFSWIQKDMSSMLIQYQEEINSIINSQKEAFTFELQMGLDQEAVVRNYDFGSSSGLECFSYPVKL